MVKVNTIKMPWRTKHFSKGQTVFVKFMTGAQACKCRGKYRGKHRWIDAWFRWNDKNMHLFEFKEIEITEEQYDNIMGA